jgi:multicomponent Na+:H+ antiporter subunit D
MNAIVPLSVALPLLGAAVVLFLNTVLPRRWVQAVALTIALVDVALVALLVYRAGSGTIVYWFGGWAPRHGLALGISFTVDQLGAGGALLSAVVMVAAMATARWTVDDAAGIVHALLLTMLAAMVGFCLTGDLFNMFVFFELMAVSAFSLAAYRTHSAAALRGALNFAITNSIGAFLVLTGIALLYSRTGALNLAQLGHQLASRGPLDRLAVLAMALLVAGFLIKGALVPFHFWLVDTASSAPISLVVVLAGALDTLGVYAVARIYWTVFAVPVATHQHAVQAVLISIGSVSAVAGAGLALLEREPRRRLGFVMVSHTGILLIGVGCLTSRGLAGAGLFAVGDGLVKAALFVALVGFRRRANAFVLGIGGLAIAGLPLFATGFGKSVIGDAASATGYPWVVPVVIAAAVISGAAVLELAWSTWVASRTDGPSPDRAPSWLVPWGVGSGLLALSAGAAALGRWSTSAATRFVDTAGYQQRVIGGAHPAAARLGSSVHLTFGGAGLEVLAVAAAVALAVLAGRRVARHGVGRIAPLAAVLRRLHLGSIGDSATWATVGTAAIALLLATGLR